MEYYDLTYQGKIDLHYPMYKACWGIIGSSRDLSREELLECASYLYYNWHILEPKGKYSTNPVRTEKYINLDSWFSSASLSDFKFRPFRPIRIYGLENYYISPDGIILKKTDNKGIIEHKSRFIGKKSLSLRVELKGERWTIVDLINTAWPEWRTYDYRAVYVVTGKHRVIEALPNKFIASMNYEEPTFLQGECDNIPNEKYGDVIGLRYHLPETDMMPWLLKEDMSYDEIIQNYKNYRKD